jgi:arabinogalactan oligomer/maltooligosaccharide transport system permease protein
MIGANKKKSDFATPYTVSNALTKGGAAVKLSALIMGLGNIAHKQIIKGLIFLAIEIGYGQCRCILSFHASFIRMEKTGRGI